MNEKKSWHFQNSMHENDIFIHEMKILPAKFSWMRIPCMNALGAKSKIHFNAYEISFSWEEFFMPTFGAGS